MKNIEVKQIKSLIGQPVAQARIIVSLGLGRIGMKQVQKDNNCIRGMINKVRHLVVFKFVD
ncbi:MAG: 50S ribosomal protein L30 [Proteobacteria bacterium]|nr:50S ribosomal protein L30 [Pseudomonadota bacterium]